MKHQLALLGLLALAPVAAQAELTPMADADLAQISGQGMLLEAFDFTIDLESRYADLTFNKDLGPLHLYKRTGLDFSNGWYVEKYGQLTSKRSGAGIGKGIHAYPNAFGQLVLGDFITLVPPRFFTNG